MLTVCPCTLSEGFSTYSPSALRKMFNGKKVNHILDVDPPELNEVVAEQFRQNRKMLSISGAQIKLSLLLKKNKLRLTQQGERGEYILKPIPHRASFAKEEQLPANEHLTMQIARQVYGIDTAENALLFFKNGEPAYITKRFDVKADGGKIAQEDFASLSGMSNETSGNAFRNMGSYESLAAVMKKYVVAYGVEAEKLFERVIFNYLFSNGDAHLKNFSLQQTATGDYLLSPAYDLIDTVIHIPTDSFMALKDGLFENDYDTESFKALGFYAYDDFYEFGLRIGVMEKRLIRLLDKYRTESKKVSELASRSFLNNEAKKIYLVHYFDRLKMLNNSYRKII